MLQVSVQVRVLSSALPLAQVVEHNGRHAGFKPRCLASVRVRVPPWALLEDNLMTWIQRK